MTELVPPSEQAARVVHLSEFTPSGKRDNKAKRSPRPGAHEDIVTEDSAALEFASLYRDRLRFCRSTGAWFEWTGTRWEKNTTGVAFRWARILARDLSKDQPDKIRYITSKTSFAGGVERFARVDEAFAVTIDSWDQDPFLLGTPSGTVDLRTGVLRQSVPSEGITKLTAVGPAETVECPRFLSFLHEATNGEADLQRLLQQWCGYCLTADTREQSLLFVYGPGGNGKGVFVNTMAGILNDYAETADMATFTASKFDKPTTDLASLRGARLVTASETEDGRALAEARIKQMTGGDKITARFMRQDNFTYVPAFKILIVGNHQPVIQNVDDAMRRRLRIVPFIYKPAKPDKMLEATLRSEWPGILRWMINGCLDWLENGLTQPKSVAEATADYFAEQDTLAHFLAEQCRCDPHNPHSSLRAPASHLFQSWSIYARNAGEGPGNAKSFKSAMLRKGFGQKHGNRGSVFIGVEMQPEGGVHESDR